METVSIYYLSDSRTPDAVRYVGLSKNPLKRLRDHKRRAVLGFDRNRKASWIKSVLSSDADVSMRIAEDGLTFEEATGREKFHIRMMREAGCDLVNGTDGGEGLLNPPASVRLKKSISMTGKKSSPETRAKISAANLGRVISDEARARMSASHLGVKLKPSHVANAKLASIRRAPKGRYKGVSLTVYGRWHSYIKIDGKRKNIGYFATPEEAAKAYDAHAFAAWGGDAWLNFPEPEKLVA